MIKKYKLFLENKILIGELEINNSNHQIKIILCEERVNEYKNAIIRLINNIKNEGDFKIEFDEDKLEIKKTTSLFVLALKQEMFLVMNFYLSG